MDRLSIKSDDMPVMLPDDGTVERRDPHALKPHPLNARLYGEEVGDGLFIDIAENGIREPLRIIADGTIISGHSRCAIAKKLGLADVPVIVSSRADPTEIVAEMISSNNKRKKTHYVLAREYQQLKPIQADLARHRQRRAAETTNAQLGRQISSDTLCANTHTAYLEKGRAGEAAAKLLGLKPRSAEYALKVVEAIDDARDKGCDNDADLLITRLNKSIIGSHKLAKALGYIIDAPSQTMIPLKTPEWAKWEWNPVTGCQGECAYCAAHDHADQAPAAFIYPSAEPMEKELQLRDPFAPRLHEWCLSAPLRTKCSRENDQGQCNVLTCWQGELFGPWVPQEWIDLVLKTVRASLAKCLPWEFMFLTKYPARLLDVDWPSNVCLGITVDVQERVREAEETLCDLRRRYPALKTYLVCEPLQESLSFTSLKTCSWMLIGGQARTQEWPDPLHPAWDWVVSLIVQALRDGCAPTTRPGIKLNWPHVIPGAEANLADLNALARAAIEPLRKSTFADE